MSALLSGPVIEQLAHQYGFSDDDMLVRLPGRPARAGRGRACAGADAVGEAVPPSARGGRQVLRTHFSLFDLDRRGRITPENLAHLLHSYHIHTSPATIQLLIAELDLNKNGLIEFDEFLRVRDGRRAEGRCGVGTAHTARASVPCSGRVSSWRTG